MAEIFDGVEKTITKTVAGERGHNAGSRNVHLREVRYLEEPMRTKDDLPHCTEARV